MFFDVNFWARYVILKEKSGVPRAVTLPQIESRFGEENRQAVEAALQDEA